MDNNDTFTPINVFFIWQILHQLLVNAIRRREREKLCPVFPRPAELELGKEGYTAFTRVTAPPVLFVCEEPVGAQNPTTEVPGSSAAGDSRIISLLLIALNCLHPPSGMSVVGADGNDGPGSAPSTSSPATSPTEHKDANQPGPSPRRSVPETRNIGIQATEAEDLRLAQLMEENDRLKKENKEKDKQLKKARENEQLGTRVDSLEKRMKELEKEKKDQEMEQLKRDMKSKLAEKELEKNKLEEDLKKAQEEKEKAQDTVNEIQKMDDEVIKTLKDQLKRTAEEKNDMEADLKKKLEVEKKKAESVNERMKEEKEKKEAAEKELEELKKKESDEIRTLRAALEEERKKNQMLQAQLNEASRNENFPSETNHKEIQASVEKEDGQSQTEIGASDLAQPVTFWNYRSQPQLQMQLPRDSPVEDVTVSGGDEELMDEESGAVEPIRLEEQEVEGAEGAETTDFALSGGAEELIDEERGAVEPTRAEEQVVEGGEAAETTVPPQHDGGQVGTPPSSSPPIPTSARPWRPTRREAREARTMRQQATPLQVDTSDFYQRFTAAEENYRSCPLYGNPFFPNLTNLFDRNHTSEIPQMVKKERVHARQLFLKYKKSLGVGSKERNHEWQKIRAENGQELADWCERDRMLFVEFKLQLERGFIRTRETDEYQGEELDAGDEEEEEEEREEKKTRKRGRPRKENNDADNNDDGSDGKKSKKDEEGPSSQP